jgi:4-carboxymuconolactone decarboxylase
MARGILDSSLLYHIKRAKMNGVTAETLTQLAFFAGWSKAWAALRMAKEVYEQE